MECNCGTTTKRENKCQWKAYSEASKGFLKLAYLSILQPACSSVPAFINRIRRSGNLFHRRPALPTICFTCDLLYRPAVTTTI